MHFYSSTDSKTKLGILIGFYLRALRICSDEFLEDEQNYIFNSFTDLKYPPFFILKAKKKAFAIHNRTDQRERLDKRIILPKSQVAENVNNVMKASGIDIITTSNVTIGNIIRKNNKKKNNNKDAGVYRINCSECDKVYIGESYRGVKKRVKEHERDMEKFVLNNAMVTHRLETGHKPLYNDARLIRFEPDLNRRRCYESAYIILNEAMNMNQGFFSLSKPLAFLLTRGKPG